MRRSFAAAYKSDLARHRREAAAKANRELGEGLIERLRGEYDRLDPRGDTGTSGYQPSASDSGSAFRGDTGVQGDSPRPGTALKAYWKEALKDGHINRGEASTIIHLLNMEQAETREAIARTIKHFGHNEVAERFNKLEFNAVLFATPRPRPEPEVGSTFSERNFRPGMTPMKRRNLIWLMIVGPSALFSMLRILAAL